MVATREIFWNIPGHNWLYLFFAVAMVFFGYGIYRRLKLWKMGRPENRWQDVWQGLKDILIYGFGHKRILKDSFAGPMHFGIFWGMFFLFFATSMIAIQEYFGWQIYHGWFYLFIKLTANLFGFTALIGIIMAAYRRYILKPAKLDSKLDDAVVLGILFVILVTGFLMQGARMAVKPDPWGAYEFIGLVTSSILSQWLDEAQLLSLHRTLWWFHSLLAMFLIGYLPYSKLFHSLLAPLNIFFRKRGPIGVPELINFEDESIEKYGVSELKDFSWSVLFNTDACTRCGRCMEFCPAQISGKHLNPKNIIQDLRGLMEEEGKALEQAKKNVRASQPNLTPEEMATAVEAELQQMPRRSLIGDVIPEEDIWACTTCRSCEQQCPVFVEHVDKTIEMRRNLVLMESQFPPEAQLAFRNLENNGNPWGIGWSTRGDFLKGLGVPTIAENPEAEILYWPGCTGSFDARNQKVAAAVVTLLRAAGVNFAILGNEEKCCGDSARKLGNEYLFQTLATENIEVMNGYGVKKILSQCPHCFNFLKNEYPQLGGNYEVVHHTTYLKQLIDEGKLKLSGKGNTRVTYHDSCYLGRYNNIYDAPRELLQLVGLELVEMESHGEKSLCCGAGGGRMWLEEHGGRRINQVRTEEALATEVNLVGTACPFCLTMFNDGINAKEAGENIKAMDIAEILVQAL